MYDQKTKEAVLNLIGQGATVKQASEEFDVCCRTIRGWIHNNGLQKSPGIVTKKRHSLETKIAVIKLYEEGSSPREISKQLDIHTSTISNWIRDKNMLLAVYSIQGSQPGLPVNRVGQTYLKLREFNMSSQEDDQDLREHNQQLKKEIEFYQAKAAYLEALLELSGLQLSDIKKKHATKLSTGSSDRGSGT